MPRTRATTHLDRFVIYTGPCLVLLGSLLWRKNRCHTPIANGCDLAGIACCCCALGARQNSASELRGPEQSERTTHTNRVGYHPVLGRAHRSAGSRLSQSLILRGGAKPCRWDARPRVERPSSHYGRCNTWGQSSSGFSAVFSRGLH